MKTEKEKMLAGELYFAYDEQLVAERHATRMLMKKFNDTNNGQQALRNEILEELIGGYTKGLIIEPPFFCDYGSNITVGKDVFFNFNCVVLDVNTVTIGDRSLFGPAVQIYTATHPMDAKTRSSGLEAGLAITIGSDVWVGGGAMICPGVTIGDRCVIGAGAVVTKDVPPDSFAAGNPCRVIRDLKEAE